MRTLGVHPNWENATPEELRVAMDAAPNRRSYVRFLAVRALLLGYSRAQVCELCARSDRMLRLWIELFNRGGMPLPLLSLLIFAGLANIWNDPFLYIASRFLRDFARSGLLWGIFIPLLVLLVVFSAAIPRYRPFYRRLRSDWTLLCFILYGAAPFMAFFQFEGYQNYELYAGLMFLILAVGGWLYLRNDSPWKKFLILIGGVTLSMFVASVGQAVLYESSLCNSHRPFPDYPWWATVDQTVIAWMWLVLIMFLPLAINLLPRPKSSLQAGQLVSG